MVKLLRDAETRELEKAKKEAEKAAQKIKEFEAVETRRKAKIDQAEREYQKALADYQFRCEQYAAGSEPFRRLIFLIRECTKAPNFWDYFSTNFRYYNLKEFAEFVNKTCPEGMKEPQRKILTEKDLE
jgi:hypothetical protein